MRCDQSWQKSVKLGFGFLSLQWNPEAFKLSHTEAQRAAFAETLDTQILLLTDAFHTVAFTHLSCVAQKSLCWTDTSSRSLTIQLRQKRWRSQCAERRTTTEEGLQILVISNLRVRGDTARKRQAPKRCTECHKALHTRSLYARGLCTEKLLHTDGNHIDNSHTDAFTHRRNHMQNSHTKTLAHRRLYTQSTRLETRRRKRIKDEVSNVMKFTCANQYSKAATNQKSQNLYDRTMIKGKMQVDSCGSRLSRLPFSEFTRKACAQYTGRRPFPLLSCVCVFAGPRPTHNCLDPCYQSLVWCLRTCI